MTQDQNQEKALAPWQQAIRKSEERFTDISNANNLVNFKSESMFAMQLITKNDYLMKIANDNPSSLFDSVINIASIGLSLNPATKYAYLVPRNKMACLDISYIGLIKLATDTGSIMWARAEMIYSNDNFVYKGTAEKPEFSTPNAFDRGDAQGVYCVAKTKEGDYLSGVMSLNEINEIRGRSEAGKKNFGPWVTDFNEMAKKTIIKRESKLWPKSDKTDRFDNAIDIINQHEGIDFEKEQDINYKLVEEVYVEIVNIITNDTDEEEDYLRVKELFVSLDNTEQMALNSKLRSYKPDGSRQYNTLLKDYLSYKKDDLIEHEDY